jgi:hypothetical protein
MGRELGFCSPVRDNADDCLRRKPRVTIFQSLDDSGCDLLIEWAADARYGVQLKSHWDISQNNFAEKTLVQIQDSRAHGLNRLLCPAWRRSD